MTNSTPWQTILNTSNASNVILKENNLTAVKKSGSSAKNFLNLGAKEIKMTRRYSFDDNGGGYSGL